MSCCRQMVKWIGDNTRVFPGTVHWKFAVNNGDLVAVDFKCQRNPDHSALPLGVFLRAMFAVAIGDGNLLGCIQPDATVALPSSFGLTVVGRKNIKCCPIGRETVIIPCESVKSFQFGCDGAMGIKTKNGEYTFHTMHGRGKKEA